MSKKKCKHVGKDLQFGYGEARQIMSARCVECGEWLPIGPSNDEPEAVRIEMRAAELEETEYWKPARVLTAERWGWEDHGDPESTAEDEEEYTATSQWAAGWLSGELERFEREICDVDTWSWDPTRPVAGQYDEWLAAQSWSCPVDSMECQIRRRCTNKCGRLDGMSADEVAAMFAAAEAVDPNDPTLIEVDGPLPSAACLDTIAAQNPIREPDTAPPDRLAACAGCEVLFGCRDGHCLRGRESERMLLIEGGPWRRADGSPDHPLTISIDSDGTPAVQLNGLDTAPPLLDPDEAEVLADDLLLGADAARQAAQDGYHGPAAIVELRVGEEREQGVEFEVLIAHPLNNLCEDYGCLEDGSAYDDDDTPIRAGAPEAIGLTRSQLRARTAEGVAAEDALRDPAVLARNAIEIKRRAEAQRAAEPDCRDEDGPEVERLMGEMTEESDRLTAIEAAECVMLSDSDVCQACGDKWTDHGRTCAGSGVSHG